MFFCPMINTELKEAVCYSPEACPQRWRQYASAFVCAAGFLAFRGGEGLMVVVKNINNNVSLCLDGNGKEVIVFGKGVV